MHSKGSEGSYGLADLGVPGSRERKK